MLYERNDTHMDGSRRAESSIFAGGVRHGLRNLRRANCIRRAIDSNRDTNHSQPC